MGSRAMTAPLTAKGFNRLIRAHAQITGTVKPIALAALRLISNSYLVGACPDSSLRLPPFARRAVTPTSFHELDERLAIQAFIMIERVAGRVRLASHHCNSAYRACLRLRRPIVRSGSHAKCLV